ncbi:MAG: acetyl-CoA carboxylase carboxyl transferase subunit alpha/beta, partial [Desulfovibrionaceae bacterium]|nr:acetyl-CoA carboxylase carboxyl transferase subunit alpha/beta [Desulfovibrionaceae bacterium]
MDADKKKTDLLHRAQYAKDILGPKKNERLEALLSKIGACETNSPGQGRQEALKNLQVLEERLGHLEALLDKQLTPMDKVRIVRHPQRICLKDILENVYDNYTEIGGKDEHSIDPGMLIARAYVTRRVGKKTLNHPVMVVGQEKGHGQEFRNGGSIKPWGNSKALKYMKVAARENIPIHAYVSTPGSYPLEDFPGAAQQIAENIYEMAGLEVPIIAIFSEGGSGGAEAVALADKRLMFSHGYYSVISPEGAAAIEGKVRGGMRAPAELIERCAQFQRITAEDNLGAGFVDAVVQEPPLGARPEHFDFYKRLRTEVIRATDEVILGVGGMRILRKRAMRRRKKDPDESEHIIVRWNLNTKAKQRLLAKRRRKFRRMAQGSFEDRRSLAEKIGAAHLGILVPAFSAVRYGLVKNVKKTFTRAAEEVTGEIHVVAGRIERLRRKAMERLRLPRNNGRRKGLELTALSAPVMPSHGNGQGYLSPQAAPDREITCPRAEKRGCMDVWARDLFGEFGGVCPYCGHHFFMEYQWYLANVFDHDSVREFNQNIASGNPTGFPDFEKRILAARKKTGLQSACMTFNASLMGIKLTCAMLIADFRGGSVGAAEGEKFIRALEMAGKRHQPFLAYSHGTAGIRIQEGVHGLIQMPRATMAVRRYIEAGGLYIVLYDTNYYSGPVASFL